MMRLGFASKISLVIGGVLAVVSAIMTVFVGYTVRVTMEREFESQGANYVRSLATNGEQLLLASQVSELQQRIEDVRKLTAVRYVVIMNDTGEVTAHTIAPAFPPELAARFASYPGQPSVVVSDVTVRRIDDVPEVGDVVDLSKPILQGVLGSAHVGMDLDVIAAEVRRTVLRIGAMFVLFTIVAIAVAWGASRILVAPAQILVSIASDVAKGDLRHRELPDTGDELAAVGASFAAMTSSLQSIARGVRRASDQVSDAATGILVSSKSQEHGAVEQSASVEELGRSMNILTASADTIAKRTEELSRLSIAMSDQMRAAQTAADSTHAVITELAAKNVEVKAQVQQLYERTQGIMDVVDLIDAISDRLDLLALNAALEGARAGDLGKGFALVAQEMRRLAENVSASTREVKQTLEAIGGATSVALTASAESETVSQSGVREVGSVVDVTRAMATLIGQSAAALKEIAGVAREQRVSSITMSAAMEQMGTVTAEAVATSQDVTNAALKLAEVANGLRQQTATFKI
jgi:methyl-accepting chemotaxis protein